MLRRFSRSLTSRRSSLSPLDTPAGPASPPFTTVSGLLWRYVALRPVASSLVVAVCAVAALLELSLSYVIKHVLDAMATSPQSEESFYLIAPLVGAVLGVLLAENFCWRISGYSGAHLITQACMRLRCDFFAWLHPHSAHFFGSVPSGSLANKAHNTAGYLDTVYCHILWDVIPAIVALTATVVLVASYGLVFVAGFLAVVVVASAFTAIVMRRWAPIFEASEKKNSTGMGIVVDIVGNMPAVTAFDTGAAEAGRVRRAADLARLADRRGWWHMDHIRSGLSTCTAFLIFGMVLAGVWLWSHSQLSLGDVGMLAMVSTVLSGHVRDFSMSFIRIGEAAGKLRNAVGIIMVPHGVVDAPGAKPLQATHRPSIDFDRVCFTYPASAPWRDKDDEPDELEVSEAKEPRSVLGDFALHISPGQRIGLVGRSGSGKTTLVKLLHRLYDIQSGVISIDGQNISQVQQGSLRRAIAIVSQDAHMFHRPLWANIIQGTGSGMPLELLGVRRMADLPADIQQRILRAAQLAHVHEFAQGLQHGYDTLVGERGVKLSGGQRQRVAIARALIADAPILVLDEATSALDSESEHHIQQAMKEAMKDRTVVVIAHRLSTLRSLDRIVVMDAGAIVEDGTHNELLAADGIYAGLWARQSGGFLPPDVANDTTEAETPPHPVAAVG